MKNIPNVKPDKVYVNRHDKVYHYIRNVDLVCHTGGDGMWSNSKRKIVHKRLELIVSDSLNLTNSSLRVYFLKKCWNTENHGLIYTDKLWMKEFLSQLETIGFVFEEKVRLFPHSSQFIDYSEQGLQGDNYVDLDIGDLFVNQYIDQLYSDKEKMLGSFSQ
jgi:hypothetical protein